MVYCNSAPGALSSEPSQTSNVICIVPSGLDNSLKLFSTTAKRLITKVRPTCIHNSRTARRERMLSSLLHEYLFLTCPSTTRRQKNWTCSELKCRKKEQIHAKWTDYVQNCHGLSHDVMYVQRWQRQGARARSRNRFRATNRNRAQRDTPWAFLNVTKK